MRSPWCSGLAAARARASSPTPLREGVWPHGGGAQERSCPSCSAHADHAGWTSVEIWKRKQTIPQRSSRWNNCTACHQLAARVHAQLCRIARPVRRYLYKRMYCVSSGSITTLTQYPLWYSTYHYTSYSWRSPLRADPHPISLLGPSLNCTPVITIIASEASSLV